MLLLEIFLLYSILCDGNVAMRIYQEKSEEEAPGKTVVSWDLEEMSCELVGWMTPLPE